VVLLSRLLRISRHRVRSLLRRRDVDNELDRELAFHVEQLVAEQAAAGLTREEAERLARRQFGNVTLFTEQSRDHRRVQWLHDVRQDLAFGVRMIHKTAGTASVSALSLALGIGASAALATTIDTARRAPLPIEHGERLVALGAAGPAAGRTGRASVLDYFTWRDHADLFEAVEATLGGERDLSGTPPDGPLAARIVTRAVTLGWFDVLGGRPLRGRLLNASDLDPDGTAVGMVISHRLWQRRYASAPDIIGRVVRVNGVRTSIVGVMPADFGFQDRRVEAWFPLRLARRGSADGTLRFEVIARLRNGITAESAREALDAASRHAGSAVRVTPLRDALYGWSTSPLLSLQAAALMVLLAACANVAVLSVAQCTARRREIAMRLALGARRGRVVRQWLTESLLLAGCGGVLGAGVAWLTLWGLSAVLSPPIGSPQLVAPVFDERTLAALAVASMAVGLALGLAPASVVVTMNPAAAIRNPGPAVGIERRPLRLQSVLLAAQVAVACVLLISAGLLGGSYARLAGRDVGIDSRDLLAFEFRAPVPSPVTVLEPMVAALEALPGVTSVSGISQTPVNSLIVPSITVLLVDATPTPSAAVGPSAIRQATASHFIATPGLFETLRTPVVFGREIGDNDGASTQWVAVVNETAARLFWPGKTALGRWITIGGEAEQPREVVGVVRDIPLRRRSTGPEPIVYTSYLQQVATPLRPFGDPQRRMTFLVRHDGDPADVRRRAENAAAAISAEQPLVHTEPPGSLGLLMLEARNYALLVTALGLLATGLAAMAISSALMRAVQDRTLDIGTRRALGAGSASIAVAIAWPTIAVVTTGLAIGLACAMAVAHTFSAQLWGIGAIDVTTFAGATVLLAACLALASLGPLRRAIAIRPAASLRRE
jgi:predicted permease